MSDPEAAATSDGAAAESDDRFTDDYKKRLLADMAAPPDDDDESPSAAAFTYVTKSHPWIAAVGIFAIFLIGTVLFFWDDMHETLAPGRPDVQGAAVFNIEVSA